MVSQPTLFDSQRGGWEEAMEITQRSLSVYAEQFRHWAIAYSGGKDSTAVVSAVAYLIESGKIRRPESLTILYADTRMELLPLHASALTTLERLRERGFRVARVMPDIDHRYFVYMFGRGVPPPGNNFRWCTGMLKIDPMQRELARMREALGEKLLVMTGVRIGESAQRDARIQLGCGKNGSECGQGWYQQTTPASVADLLAPIIHWRVCSVWDWLFFHAPKLTGLPTHLVAEAYGGELALESQTRTGCVGCPVASRDFALEGVVLNPRWAYLRPLLRLRDLYEELRRPKHRIRKSGTERTADGSLVRNPCRMGPLTMEARRWGMERVLEIQAEVNAGAGEGPKLSILNEEECQRIEELIMENTWPDKWTGEEQRADLPYSKVNPDGSVQPIMESLFV